jgi:hypothetical protein
MRAQIESRLNTLRIEFEKGQLQAQQLQSQLASVRETMLRISGAIMVLEEILSESTAVALVEQDSPEMAAQSSSFAA